MRWFLIFSCLLSIKSLAQDSSSLAALNEKFRATLNEEYKNPKTSPLTTDEIEKFKGHDFYPFQIKYRVWATFTSTPNEPVFQMRTSSPKKKDYRLYGIVEFSIDNKKIRLNVYQSMDLLKQEKYKDYLFLPFGDETNGRETYGGGRYIDLRIPSIKDGKVLIDFNEAYNPFCAYSGNYSCPLIPRENIMDIPIYAGVRLKK